MLYLLDRQNDLLRQHLNYVGTTSPFYRRHFSESGIHPSVVRNISDLTALPFTTKEDLESSSQDFLCVDGNEVVDVCLTSGTTGKPVAVLQTSGDLERLGYNEEISFRAAGITPRDRVLIAAAIDRCFMAGLAYFLGLTRIGATAIRGGSSSIAMLVEAICSQRPTAIVGVPTLMLAVADRLLARGDDPALLGVRRLVCIGELVRQQDLSLSGLGQKLQERWHAMVYGTYASTEMATTFADCEKGRGGHIHPDLIIAEIVDEEGNPVPPGQAGEVVATPLGVTGMPLVRFKTGDISVLHTTPCPCGRNSYRLGPIVGRKKQMLKYRGTTVYPPAIFAVLQEIPGIQGYFIEVREEYELSDHIRVVVGSEGVEAEAIAESIAARVRVKPEVTVMPPAEVLRRTTSENKRKPVTFFDYRRKHEG